LLKLLNHRVTIRVALNYDDSKLGLPCQIAQEQPLSLADAFTFPRPFTNTEFALAFKHHVNVAGRRLGVGFNQSFELKKVNVRRVLVTHKPHG
jgi:hypothetical protein